MGQVQNQNIALGSLPIPTPENNLHGNVNSMPRELARYLLTQTAEAVQVLTKPQKDTMNQLESNLIFAKESKQYSSYSDFLNKSVDMSFFAASFFLNTPVVAMMKDYARQTLLNKS